MTISPWVTYAAGFASIGVFSRLWVKFKRDRAARRLFATTLFEQGLLNALFAPHAPEGDDPDVLAEMSATLSHLNRSIYAEEFWGLDKQLVSYYATLPRPSRPTMRRALVRMLIADNRWLQIVAAKTCASVGLPEAIPALKAILEHSDSFSYSEPKTSDKVPESAEDRFREQIEASLISLEAAVKPSGELR